MNSTVKLLPLNISIAHRFLSIDRNTQPFNDKKQRNSLSSSQSPSVRSVNTRRESPNPGTKSETSKASATSSQNTKPLEAASSQPPSLSVDHRSLSECPCGRSSDNKSWKMAAQNVASTGM